MSRLGARLRATGVVFDSFDATPLTRARETAEVLLEDLPGPALRIVPELAECTPPTRRAEVAASERMPRSGGRCSGPRRQG